MHLLYGIIIGILLFASTGSMKKDKAEFETEKVFPLGRMNEYNVNMYMKINNNLSELKENGWTIIDYSTCSGAGGTEHFVLCGK